MSVSPFVQLAGLHRPRRVRYFGGLEQEVPSDAASVLWWVERMNAEADMAFDVEAPRVVVAWPEPRSDGKIQVMAGAGRVCLGACDSLRSAASFAEGINAAFRRWSRLRRADPAG